MEEQLQMAEAVRQACIAAALRGMTLRSGYLHDACRYTLASFDY